MNLRPGQRFRQLTLRDDVLFGDFTLESVPVPRNGYTSDEEGSGPVDHVMFFTGKVEGEPSVYKLNALRALRQNDPAALGVHRADLLKQIANPAGDIIAVPVGAVIHAVPMEEE